MILNSSTHIIDDLSSPSPIDNLFGLMDMKVDPAKSPGYKIGYDNAGELISPPQVETESKSRGHNTSLSQELWSVLLLHVHVPPPVCTSPQNPGQLIW